MLCFSVGVGRRRVVPCWISLTIQHYKLTQPQKRRPPPCDTLLVVSYYPFPFRFDVDSLVVSPLLKSVPASRPIPIQHKLKWVHPSRQRRTVHSENIPSLSIFLLLKIRRCMAWTRGLHAARRKEFLQRASGPCLARCSLQFPNNTGLPQFHMHPVLATADGTSYPLLCHVLTSINSFHGRECYWAAGATRWYMEMECIGTMRETCLETTRLVISVSSYGA